MSDKISPRALDTEGVADGDYALTVTGGHVTGLTAASAGSGGVSSIVAGTGIAVDATDPANPVVSATGGGGGSTDTWHRVGAAGEPAFANSWVNYGSGEQPAAFTKINGVVHLAGVVKLGTGIGASPMFTLPVGYRPPSINGATNEWSFVVTSNGGFGRVAIFLDGRVIPVTGSNAYFRLETIHYPAA